MDDYQKPTVVCCECSKTITDGNEIGGRHGRTLFISFDLTRKKSNIIEVIKERLSEEGNICYLPSDVWVHGFICKDCLNKKGMINND